MPLSFLRGRSIRVALVAAPLALAACSDQESASAPQRRPAERPALTAAQLADPNGVIVELKALDANGGIPEEVRKAIDAQGARILSFDRASRLLVVAGLTNSVAIDALPSTGIVTANLEHHLLTNQSGAGLYAAHQQNLPWINVPGAWANTSWNGAGTRICIIDTGIDDVHPELAGLVVGDTNLVNAEASNSDGNGHGTHVASTAVSKGLGIGSVAPGARLLNARVFDDAGQGATTARVVAAIRWCGRQGAHVINMSLGFNGGLARGSALANEVIALEQPAVDEVLNGTNPTGSGTGGTITVASAGNDGARIPSQFNIWLPAELNNVVAVGSTLRGADTRSVFTNRGGSVDVYAPGSNIVAACSTTRASCTAGLTFPGQLPGNAQRYLSISGTSMAAPHVAGVTSLIYSSYGGTRSAANGAKVTSCLIGRALTNRVQQLPDAGGRRTDALLAQTGRSAGSGACPI